jgi:hypothetical protein
MGMEEGVDAVAEPAYNVLWLRFFLGATILGLAATLHLAHEATRVPSGAGILNLILPAVALPYAVSLLLVSVKRTRRQGLALGFGVGVPASLCAVLLILDPQWRAAGSVALALVLQWLMMLAAANTYASVAETREDYWGVAAHSFLWTGFSGFFFLVAFALIVLARIE